MTLEAKTLQSIARDMLGREVAPEVAADTVSRLETMLAWVNGADDSRFGTAGPAGLLDLTRAGWHAPSVAPAVHATVTPTGRGSGYGAPPSGAIQGSVAAARFADEPPVGIPIPAGPLQMGAADLAAAISNRAVTASEAVEAALARIADLDPALNAFITVTGEDARAAAAAADHAVRRGDVLGPLHGVPVAIKDIIETAGVRTTCGSKILADYVPAVDATVVQRLKTAGAIVIGKTNTHEFAFGPTTVNPHYGACHNPYNPACVSGGSSGGSAVAVATGMAPLAMGTDTGGSVRIPAACCGLVGLKPTYGRVSKAGVFPLSWSLDHPGPIARSVLDVALALSVLAGHDVADPSTVATAPADDWVGAARTPGNLSGLKAGIPRDWDTYRITDGVRAGFAQAIEVLRDLGVRVETIEFPTADAMLLANRLLILPEAAAYHLPTLRARPDDYGADVRVRLELGQYMLASHYLTGQRLRAELCRSVAAVMQQVDVILTPALALAAPYIGQTEHVWDDGAETIPDALIRCPAPFNITGQPALVVPCGQDDGRPVGIQIVGRAFAEATVLRVGAALEAAMTARQAG